jgi:DNA-binding IclR family transcriptional regulator
VTKPPPAGRLKLVAETSSKWSDEGYKVPAVERTFLILKILAATGPMSLASVVQESNLNKSTVFYILRTLSNLDIVYYDERTKMYELGIGLIELGIAAGEHITDIDLAKRELTELLDVMDVSIVLYRRVSRDEITLVDKLERPHRVRITLQAGRRVPIQGGSFGRAFLAFDSDAQVNEVLRAGLHQFTSKSVTDKKAFLAELAMVRRRGWAVDHEGFAIGVSTVAAPIFDAGGEIMLVAAAVGFTNWFTDEVTEACGMQLRRICDRIGHALAEHAVAAPKDELPKWDEARTAQTPRAG